MPRSCGEMLSRSSRSSSEMSFESDHFAIASSLATELYDQALLHASTGRDILLTYLQSLKNDMPREAFLALARSHYILGKVLTEKMQYPSFLLPIYTHSVFFK